MYHDMVNVSSEEIFGEKKTRANSVNVSSEEIIRKLTSCNSVNVSSEEIIRKLTICNSVNVSSDFHIGRNNVPVGSARRKLWTFRCITESRTPVSCVIFSESCQRDNWLLVSSNSPPKSSAKPLFD